VNATNPLLRLNPPIPFDEIQPGHVTPGIRQLIGEAKERIEAIGSGTERTYANTLEALDLATEPLDRAMSVVRHLEAVATTPELRQAYTEVQPEAAAFNSSLPLNSGLWNTLKTFEATAEAASLAGVRKRYLVKKIDSYRRHGAELDEAGKKRLNEIDVELSTITTKFAQNVLDSTAQFEHVTTREPDLAGLPPTAIAAARHSAESKGRDGWRFTLQAPSYLAVMTYLDDCAVREHFYRSFNRRAAEPERDNSPIIARVLELRREKARLLGYANFADFVLADRMAKTGGAALQFVQDLESKTAAPFAKENQALVGFAGRELQPWDIAYYAEKQRAEQYDFKEEDLRPYFPLNQVVEGLFELVRRLYGIHVVQTPGVPVWHEDTRHYEVRDDGGEVLGAFYADWFPRDTKRQGAWMDAFVTGHPENGHWTPHVGLMCGNLTPPLKATPSLLTHREVETIFHEFGHLLHHLLSRVEVRELAGTCVAWDFVELPSQIMENWCWERESLDLFARHWQTGQPVPEDLFQKLRRARTFRGANQQMRQLGFATVDLNLHVAYDPDRDGDPVGYSRRILQRFAPAKLPEDYAMINAFTHLFADPTGYGAGYYSYKWAEVLDADAFSRFRDGGLFSRETGDAFRECILSKGDSQDPAVLFRNFMGRDPDPGALLRRLGLAS